MALGKSTTDKYIFLCTENMWEGEREANIFVFCASFFFSLASKTPSNRFMPSSKAIFMHACVQIVNVGSKSMFTVHHAQEKCFCYFAFSSFFFSSPFIPFSVRFFLLGFLCFFFRFFFHGKIMNHHPTEYIFILLGGWLWTKTKRPHCDDNIEYFLFFLLRSGKFTILIRSILCVERAFDPSLATEVYNKLCAIQCTTESNGTVVNKFLPAQKEREKNYTNK